MPPRRWMTAVCVALVCATVVPAARASGDPPIAEDDTTTAIQDEPKTLNVLENDHDPEYDPLSVTDNTGSAEGGPVDCESNGDCTYQDPGGLCPYEDSFSYTISDGTSTDTATVTVHVECGDGGGGGGGGGGETYRKSLGLRLTGHLKARGEITAEIPRCESDQRVTVQKKEEGQWSSIKTGRTSQNGSYSIRLTNLFGIYRATTPTSRAGDDCRGDNSRSRSYYKYDPQTISDGNDVSGPLDVKTATLDRDSKFFYVTIKTHGKWSRSDLDRPSERFETFFWLGGGSRYWITASYGEDNLIIDVLYCEQQCDYGNEKFGKGERLNGRTVRFWAKKDYFSKLGSKINWQGGSAYQDYEFDVTPKKDYKLG